MTITDPVLARLDEIVAALTSAGIPATRDPGELQPPAVIIAAPTITDATMGGVLQLDVPIYPVTGDPGAAGLTELLDLVDAVRGVLGIVSAAPALYTSPINPAGLPAYLIPYPTTVDATGG
jgi:hypothetical protein